MGLKTNGTSSLRGNNIRHHNTKQKQHLNWFIEHKLYDVL